MDVERCLVIANEVLRRQHLSRAKWSCPHGVPFGIAPLKIQACTFSHFAFSRVDIALV